MPGGLLAVRGESVHIIGKSPGDDGEYVLFPTSARHKRFRVRGCVNSQKSGEAPVFTLSGLLTG